MKRKEHAPRLEPCSCEEAENYRVVLQKVHDFCTGKARPLKPTGMGFTTVGASIQIYRLVDAALKKNKQGEILDLRDKEDMKKLLISIEARGR